MRITRRHLQISLGLLWLLDGVLQCQPFMFTRQFAHQVLASAGSGQPSVLAGLMHESVVLVSMHPALANGAFALVQLLLGLGLLTKRFSRVTLGLSVVWALSVWVVGEGLGGLATGATILTGAPGAALLYAVIALLAWPARDTQSSSPPSWLALPAWCALWVVGAALQLIHANNSGTSFTMMLRTAQVGAPGWIAGIDHHLSQLRIPLWFGACAIALYMLVAIWALVPGWTRQLSIGLGVFISLVGWVFFQAVGDLTSGQATDPSTGPLVILLALAVLGAYAHKPALVSLDVPVPANPKLVSLANTTALIAQTRAHTAQNLRQLVSRLNPSLTSNERRLVTQREALSPPVPMTD
jgi:hypothetical protein